MKNYSTVRRFTNDLFSVSRKNTLFVLFYTTLNSFTTTLGIVLVIPLLSLTSLEFDGDGWLVEWVRLPESWGVEGQFLLILTVYVVLVSLGVFVGRQASVRSAQLVQAYTRHLRDSLFSRVFLAEFEQVSRRKKSDLVNAFTMEIARVSNGVLCLLRLVSSVVVAVPQLVIAFFVSPTLTLFVCAGGAILFVSLFSTLRQARGLGHSLQRLNQGLQKEIHEQLYGLKELKSYGVEEEQVRLFQQTTKQMEENIVQYTAQQSKPDVYYKIGAAVLISLFLYVSLIVLQEDLASLLVVVLIFARLWPLFSAFQKNLQLLIGALPVYEHVQELMGALTPEITAIQHQPVSFSKRIELDKVSFAYEGKQEQALRSVSFSVEAGSLVALVGPSGSGKSTLVDLLLGFIEPSSGEVRIEGTRLTKETRAAWQSMVRYIPQSPFLFHGTIRDNIARFHHEVSDQEITEALSLAGAAFVWQLPDGLDTVIGDFGLSLSGGEKQKIVLARALVKQPKVLILDEATSAIDQESERLIHETIRSLKGRMTILFITHDRQMADTADTVIELGQGQVIRGPEMASKR